MRIFGLGLDIFFESWCMARGATVEVGFQVCFFVIISMEIARKERMREREGERGVEKFVSLFRRKEGMLYIDGVS